MDELKNLIAEIREKVRARHPKSAPGDIPLPDLLPIVHARDAAQAKVASIGKVNPRAGGLVNGIIQRIKLLLSRALDWHVREQVEFNSAMVRSLEAVLAALEENNRALRDLAGRIPNVSPLERDLGDLQAHWIAWRAEWERKLSTNEVQFLRGLADLQNAFHHRVTLMEANHRELAKSQHSDFEGALERANLDIQKRLWVDMERVRLEYDTLIHNELRMVRQRAGLIQSVPPTDAAPPGQFDYWKFSEKFRGPEEYVRRGQQVYIEHFQGCKEVLDLGCGRGEFLELMWEHGIGARGIDQNEELVALCVKKGLKAEAADLFEHLGSLTDQSLDGLFCAQVAEHLPPPRLAELVRLAYAKLRPGGVFAVETPNPECLAIFSTHFYLDPTHTRPIPPMLMAFYFEESGFGGIQIHRFSAAVESMPSLASLPEDFRKAFFDCLDYSVLGKRLS